MWQPWSNIELYQHYIHLPCKQWCHITKKRDTLINVDDLDSWISIMAINHHTNNSNFLICVCVMFSIAPQKTSRLLQYHTVVNYNVFMEFFKRQTETTWLTILTQISIMKSASTITGKSQKSVFTYSTVFTGDSFTEIYIYNVKIENLEWIGIVTHSKIHYKGIPTQLSMQIINNKQWFYYCSWNSNFHGFRGKYKTPKLRIQWIFSTLYICLRIVAEDPRIYVSTKTNFFRKPRNLVSRNWNEFTAVCVNMWYTNVLRFHGECQITP